MQAFLGDKMNSETYKIAICDDSKADAAYISTLVKEWAKDRILKSRLLIMI